MSSIPVSEVCTRFIDWSLAVRSNYASQFYCIEHQGIGENFGRFAFCKDLDTLRQAGDRLQALGKYLV